ncbi:MAG: hypothetical protein NT121_15975 [Chloroflexi bacterium]|nr:hypothetical protein [Chloroflexota bacterium]
MKVIHTPEHQYFKVSTSLRIGKVTLYGTDWCGHTTHQKQAFDEANIAYDYVNCETSTGKCAGITSFPTVKGFPNAGDEWVGYRAIH